MSNKPTFRLTDPILDHATLTAHYFYPWPNRFDDPFFVQGDGFRLGCRYRRISPSTSTPKVANELFVSHAPFRR